MKLYKCCECGHVFEGDEVAVWTESRGEFWGFPAYEEMTGCPRCKGDYDEAVKCEVCEGYFLSEELEDGICEDCREKEDGKL